MSEQTPLHGEPMVQNDARYEATLQTIGRLAAQPGRPYTNAFYQATHDLLTGGGDVAQEHENIIRRQLYERPHYLPINVARGYQRSMGAMELWRIDDNRNVMYPLGMNKPEAWQEPQANAIKQPLNLWIFNQFIDMDVNSNIASRGALLELVGNLHDLAGPLKIIEFGSSQHHVGKKLLLHHQPGFGFRPIQGIQAVTAADRTTYLRDRPLGEALTRTVRRSQLTVDSYLGIDTQDPRESRVRTMALSSSFYLEELAQDWRRRKEFEKLDAIKDVVGLTFFEADAAEPLDAGDIWRQHPGQAGGADLGFLSFVLYLLKPAQRPAMIENMLNLLHDKGKAIIFDAIKVSPDGELEFSEDWKDYSASVAVYDKARPNLGWQTLFTSQNGRARQLIGELALADLPAAKRLGITPSRRGYDKA